jgi:hypothetical protein
MRALYVCSHPDCGRTYVNSSILKRHIQAFHNAEKRFQCSFCSKCLASRQNLKEHSYIHTGEKPYACQVPGCGATFRQGTHLSAHKRSQHSQYAGMLSPSPAMLYANGLNFLTRLVGQILMSEAGEVTGGNEEVLLKPIGEKQCCKLPSLFMD